MDVVSGAFATVSLSIQLIETVQKARKFLKSIQEAPLELSRLIEKLDQFYLTIKGASRVIEQQQNCAKFVASVDLLEAALQSCCSSVKDLDLVVHDLHPKIAHQQRIRRAWGSIAAHLKNDDVQLLRDRIAESMSLLTIALVTNSYHFASVIWLP